MGAMKQAMIAELPDNAEVALDHSAATIAQEFHETYERLAPDFGYRTREASAKPWDDVPEQNKALMTAVTSELLERGVISHCDAPIGDRS